MGYFQVGNDEYLVLTDAEADKTASDYIAETVWAFNPAFLAGQTGLDEDIFKALQKKSESSNTAIMKLIKAHMDWQEFVEDAVNADGRGHFIASYDGKENEHGGFYIYQQ